MATKSYYLTATNSVEGPFRTIDETPVTAATNPDGWVVGTGSTAHSEYALGQERASSSFTFPVAPEGVSTLVSMRDAFRSTNAVNGSFASGDWAFNFVVRGVTSASTQNGRIRFRIIVANANGSSATEITSGHQQASLTGAIANTTSDFTSSLTVNPGAFSVGANQYLFIQLAWERTAAGPMSTSDVNWRTGSSSSAGTRIVTSDFTPAQNVETPRTAQVVDAYSQLNSTGGQNFVNLATGRAQSFQGDGREVVACQFYVRLNGTVTGGSVRGALYTTQSSGSVVDSVIATTASMDPSILSTSYAPVTFTFSPSVTLAAGTWYAFGLEVISAITGGGFVQVSVSTALTHAGTGFIMTGGAWNPSGTADTPFTVLAAASGATTLYAPTVTPVAPAGQAVTGETIASTLVVRTPSVGYGLLPPTTIHPYRAFTTSPIWEAVSSWELYGGSGAFEMLGQPFTVVSAVTATDIVQLPLDKSGTPTDGLLLEILTGSLTGTVVATSATLPASAVVSNPWIEPEVPQYYTFTFSSLSLSPGQYWARLSRTGSRDLVNCCTWIYNASNGGKPFGMDLADDERGWNRNGGTWTKHTQTLIFSLRILSPLPAPTVTPVVPADQAITADTITSTLVVSTPTVSQPTAQAITTAFIGGTPVTSTFVGSEDPLSEGGLWAAVPHWVTPTKNNGVQPKAGGTPDEQSARLTTAIGLAQSAEITYDTAPSGTWVGICTFLGTSTGSCYLSLILSGTLRLYRCYDNGSSLEFQLIDQSDTLDTSVSPRRFRVEVRIVDGYTVIRHYFNGVLQRLIGGLGPEIVPPNASIGVAVEEAYTGKITSFSGAALGSAVLFAPTVAEAGGADQAITTAAITTAISLFAPSVAPGPVTVLAPSIAATAQLFVPSVTPGAVSITTALIIATSLAQAPTLAVGPVTITTAVLASTAVLFAPTITTGPVAVITATLSSTATPFAPTVAPQAVTVTTVLIASTATLAEPIVSQGAVVVLLPLVSSTAQLFTPTLSTITFASGVHVASTAQLFPPAVTPTITAGTLTNLSSLFSPSLATLTPITTATIASGSQLASPTITTGAVSITTSAIASTAQLFSPSLTAVAAITTSPIAATTTLFALSLSTGAVSISLASIASLAQLFSPTVVPAGVDVITSPIAATTTLAPPTLRSDLAVTTAPIASTTTLYPGRVALAQEITTALILNASIVSPGVITVGPVSVLLGLWSTSTRLFPPRLILERLSCPANFLIDKDWD